MTPTAPFRNSTRTSMRSGPWPRIWRRTPSPTVSHGACAVCTKDELVTSSLYEVEAAVDLDRLAGDVRRVVGCEEDNGVGNVFRCAFAPDRGTRGDGLPHLGLRERIVERRRDETG